jgi:DNA-binding MarR family transcriptional regulator
MSINPSGRSFGPIVANCLRVFDLANHSAHDKNNSMTSLINPFSPIKSKLVNRLNSIQSVGRYKKDEIVKKEMYKLLRSKPEGIGSKEFVEKIRATTKASRGKIFSMIKKYEQLGIMKIERNPKDKRCATYYPNLQKVKTEQRFSEGMEFIQTLLSEPKTEFAESETRSSGIRVSVGIFTNWGGTSSHSLEDQVRSIAKQFSSNYDRLLGSKDMKVRPSTKLAFIITMESQPGVKP